MRLLIGESVRLGAASIYAAFAAATFAVVASSAQPMWDALAYNCPGSVPYNSQQDAFNGQGHHWLGYCSNGAGTELFYAGGDKAGTVLSLQYLQLRAWDFCEGGSNYYNQSKTQYYMVTISLSTPIHQNCETQADSQLHEHQTLSGGAQWDWWDYLNY